MGLKLKEAAHGIRVTLDFWSNYRSYVKNGSVDKAFEHIEYLNYLLYQKNKIISYFDKHDVEIYKNELSCLRRALPYKMTCDVEDYEKKLGSIEKELESITFDKYAGLYFLMRNGKRLYFKKSLNTRKQVEEYYSYLAYEQTANSPHKYCDENFSVQRGEVLADCGAAEGLFGLDNIESVDKLYLFEYEEEWIEALEYTFLPYKDKVEIIPKFLGKSTDNEKIITLDDYFTDKKITFIKMDLEGCEYDVLQGAAKILQRDLPLKLAVTVYHNKKDESEILGYLSDIAPDFSCEKSKGYLLCGWETAEPPFFRSGVLRIQIHPKKENDNGRCIDRCFVL